MLLFGFLHGGALILKPRCGTLPRKAAAYARRGEGGVGGARGGGGEKEEEEERQVLAFLNAAASHFHSDF